MSEKEIYVNINFPRIGKSDKNNWNYNGKIDHLPAALFRNSVKERSH